MISFKNDDFLGKTVTKFNIYCSIGAEPLRSVSQLRFAAGWHKFSSLCGFVFQSANPSASLKEFMVSFICKPKTKNTGGWRKDFAQWFMLKKIDESRIDVLDQRTMSISYGFDINRFFESDLYAKCLPKFKACIEHGLEEAAAIAEKRPDINIYIDNIYQAIPVLMSSTKFNDAYYKLVNYDIKKPAV